MIKQISLTKFKGYMRSRMDATTMEGKRRMGGRKEGRKGGRGERKV
jgi:hypothetical protein